MVGPILIFLVVGSLFAMLHSFTTNDPIPTQEEPALRQEFDYSGRPVQQMANRNQFVLTRDQRLSIGKYDLLFKGFEEKRIRVDLYLMEMDPEQPYPKYFTKKEAKRGITLGRSDYRLVSVNKQNLILKRIDPE